MPCIKCFCCKMVSDPDLCAVLYPNTRARCLNYKYITFMCTLCISNKTYQHHLSRPWSVPGYLEKAPCLKVDFWNRWASGIITVFSRQVLQLTIGADAEGVLERTFQDLKHDQQARLFPLLYDTLHVKILQILHAKNLFTFLR